MGGGGWYHVPKVWSPSGGWWVTQKHWKVNTGVAAACIFMGMCATFTVSIGKERRPIPPAWRIPSQSWAVHALKDDPRLADPKF